MPPRNGHAGRSLRAFLSIGARLSASGAKRSIHRATDGAPMNRPQNQAVHSALAAWAPHLISISNAQWQFSLINGSSHLVQAKAEGDWLLMETECPGLDRSWSLWDAAVGNATICGLAKLVWSRD